MNGFASKLPITLILVFFGISLLGNFAMSQTEKEKSRPSRPLPPPPPPPPVPPRPAQAPLNQKSCDVFGREILKTFDKKYTADKIFERATTKISGLKDRGSVTQKGRDTLMNVVDTYKEMYSKFLEQVETECSYTPKASSGAKRIDLVKATDWAEGLIEFIDLVTKFQQTLESNISAQTNRDNLKKECDAMEVRQCESPCVVTGIIKKVCSLK